MGNIEKFDQMAARYDTDDRAVVAAAIGEAIRRTVKPGTHRVAMDYGCGTGLVGLQLVDLFQRMLLVDASQNMVAQVDRKLREMGILSAEAICADLMADPPPPLQVDCIIVVQVLLHMKEVEPLLIRLRDALNPAGQLLIVDFVRNDAVQSSDVHSGFDPDALTAQLQSLGLTCAGADVFYHGQRLFMNQDASLFLIDARK